MNRFSATSSSEAVVAADRETIWAVLTDPDMLPALTPMLSHIVTDGDLWRWEMTRIGVLGASISPSFTERMVFLPPSRIEYTHAPPAGRREHTAAEGWYDLLEVEEGTHLRIGLTVFVDLPLARVAAPAVRRVMESVMARIGDRFAANLREHLGLPR